MIHQSALQSSFRIFPFLRGIFLSGTLFCFSDDIAVASFCNNLFFCAFLLSNHRYAFYKTHTTLTYRQSPYISAESTIVGNALLIVMQPFCKINCNLPAILSFFLFHSTKYFLLLFHTITTVSHLQTGMVFPVFFQFQDTAAHRLKVLK